MLYAYFTTGIYKKTLGTGFVFLNPNWIVTAKHVVIEHGIARKNLYAGYREISIKCQVSFIHKKLDLALLVMEKQSPCERPLMPSHHEFSGNQGLISIGYKPSISIKDFLVEVNYIRDFELIERERSQIEELIYFKSAQIECGNSGGPLLGNDGGVIGVLIESRSDNGITYGKATDIRNLLRSLEPADAWLKCV